MSKIFDKVFQQIPNFTKYLVVAGIIVTLAFLFPTNAKFKYRFASGQTWLYDDLFANFDFAIKKTQDEINEDRIASERDFSPFYEIDLNIISSKKKEFVSLSQLYGFKLMVLNSDGDKSWAISSVDEHWSCYGHNQIAKQIKQHLLEYLPQHKE